MTRIALGIEYDGSGFSGWQRQAHCTGVQEVLERALSRVADHPVETVCAGRTDAGVHATAQVVHFDTAAERSPRAWTLGTNCHLPPEVCVTWAQPVAEDFHARYSATARSYRYIIQNRDVRPGLLRGRVAWDHWPLNAERMAAAARCLIGEHDFSSFRAQGCQARHPRREILAIDVQRHGEFIHLDVTANAFLHHMVRNIAGTLMAVGRGEQPVDWVREVLEARDRKVAGITAAAAGLYLVQVRYPERFGVPQEARVPRFG
ncbi:MAG: tRNA pseudouridine(38-40) synthase TruA [Gammaproteobacteria bacterium]